jgi:hypothetical protein
VSRQDSKDLTKPVRSSGTRPQQTLRQLMSHRGAVRIGEDTVQLTSMGRVSEWKKVYGAGLGAMFERTQLALEGAKSGPTEEE